jgi:hypothetical protein
MTALNQAKAAALGGEGTESSEKGEEAKAAVKTLKNKGKGKGKGKSGKSAKGKDMSLSDAEKVLKGGKGKADKGKGGKGKAGKGKGGKKPLNSSVEYYGNMILEKIFNKE